MNEAVAGRADVASLKGQITQSALSLGFDKIGFAAPGHLDQAGAHLREFLEEGRHGSMEWMRHREAERADIRVYWPPVRTVVVLAMNYYTEAPQRPSGAPHWSNYAWGDDYHKIIKKRLKQLAESLRQSHPHIQTRVCVDTSPVMEKAWAQRGGLGWQGKHTNLISRDFGSWLFLAELLIDVPIVPDAPFEEDLCGSCTACIAACPTGALDSPYQLDSRKCISYLTIEHKGPFSGGQDEQLQGWIYGCDICQEVCPWNEKFARVSSEVGYRPRPFAAWNLQQWKELTEEQWDLQFRGSAARRPGYNGLMRNITAAKQVDSNPGAV